MDARENVSENQAERLNVGDRAPDVEVCFASGLHSSLGDHWRQRPLLLALTRHLGCAFCREQLLALKDRWDEFQTAGVGVLGVTMRSVNDTLDFQRHLQLPFDLIADPERTVYQAYGAERGSAWQVLGLPVWPRALKATLRGGMGMPRGDIMQLHASFLIDTAGVIRLAHYPDSSADQLSCSQCMEAVPEA